MKKESQKIETTLYCLPSFGGVIFSYLPLVGFFLSFSDERRKQLMGNQMWWNLRFFSTRSSFLTCSWGKSNSTPKKSLIHFSPFLSPLFLFFGLFIFLCHLFSSLFLHQPFLGQIKFQLIPWPKKVKGRFSDPGQRGRLISLVLAALQIALIFPGIQTCWLFIKISHYRGNQLWSCTYFAMQEILNEECWRLNCSKRMAITGKVVWKHHLRWMLHRKWNGLGSDHRVVKIGRQGWKS